MPRHPPNALTSRLRVHTTNDNTGSARKPTRNSARAVKRSILMWMIYLSLCCSSMEFQSRSSGKSMPSRHRFEKPIHNVKKLAAIGRNTAHKSGSRYLHPWISLVGQLTRRAVSRSKAAPCGALRSAGRALHDPSLALGEFCRRSCPAGSLNRQNWWSLSGSNR